MTNKKDILVSGSHRSGTTWTGKIIASSSNVEYIDEPFNLNHNQTIHTPLKYWYEYVCDKDNPERIELFRNYIDKNMRFKWNNYFSDIKKAKSFRQFAKFNYIYYNKLTDKRKLIKDPIALMSAEWLAKEYDLDVLLLVRHPAAFVASLKVKDWKFDFFNFYEQKFLMEDKLFSFKDEIKDFVDNPNKNIVDQGILLWNIIYATIADYQKKYPNWMVVTHERLSLNPIEEYQSIFRKFDLEFTSKVQKNILNSSESGDSKLKRDSKSNIHSWKNRLSPAEIEKIKAGTAAISNLFYREEDW
ncbi:MAG: sulfotransferase [Chitinophagales bacterium]|nr:sulfotransferase [Chitinophagales bacterium]